jgi:hypothetical protein
VPDRDQPAFTLTQRIVLAVVPRLVWALLRLLNLTWRFEVINPEAAIPVLFGQQPGPASYCFWHQCILPGSVYFRRSHAVLLISQSYDGELITRIARLLGYEAVRGSSSRGSREGLMGLKRSIENGKAAIFTADGPRGPIFQSKMGPIKLAQMTGTPIGVFHVEPERAWVLRSWDHFLIPKPFTRICVSWSKEINISTDLPPEEFEPCRKELDAALERARQRALEHFNKPDFRKLNA